MLPRSNAKLTHYLPRSYQGGFADGGGKLAVYDREQRRFDRRHPLRIAAIRHYYTPEGEAYLRDLDGRGISVIRKLDNREEIGLEERDSLAAYAAVLVTRVPRMLKALNEVGTQMERELNRIRFPSPDALRAAMETSNLSEEERAGFNADLMFEMIQTGDYYKELTQHGRTMSLLDHAAPLLDSFREMRWIIGHADENTAFITSDFPVVMLRSPNIEQESNAAIGYLTPGIRKAFPLSSRSCLYMDGTGDGLLHANFSRMDVRLTNLEVAAQCERYVLGRDMQHVENIVRKTRVDQTVPRPLFRIS
jgi:hypothetical protein